MSKPECPENYTYNDVEFDDIVNNIYDFKNCSKSTYEQLNAIHFDNDKKN